MNSRFDFKRLASGFWFLASGLSAVDIGSGVFYP